MLLPSSQGKSFQSITTVGLIKIASFVLKGQLFHVGCRNKTSGSFAKEIASLSTGTNTPVLFAEMLRHEIYELNTISH